MIFNLKEYETLCKNKRIILRKIIFFFQKGTIYIPKLLYEEAVVLDKTLKFKGNTFLMIEHLMR